MNEKLIVVKKRNGYVIHSRALTDRGTLNLRRLGTLWFDESQNDWMFTPLRFPFIRLGEYAIRDLHKLVSELNKHEKETDYRGVN